MYPSPVVNATRIVILIFETSKRIFNRLETEDLLPASIAKSFLFVVTVRIILLIYFFNESGFFMSGVTELFFVVSIFVTALTESVLPEDVFRVSVLLIAESFFVVSTGAGGK